VYLQQAMNSESMFSAGLRALERRLHANGVAEVPAIQRIEAAGVRTMAALVHLAGDGSADESLRLDACWLIPRLHLDKSEPVLTSLLHDPLASVRSEAARGLGALGDANVVRTLLERLENDLSKDVRLAAIQALGILSQAASAGLLQSIVLDPHEDEEVRADATEALAHVHADGVVDTLLLALAAPSPWVRYSAAYALGEQRDPRALPALQKTAANDTAFTEYGGVGDRAAEAARNILGSGC